MNGKIFNTLCYLALICALSIIYITCFNLSYKGYGYPGYRGYHHRHSFWYLGGHDYSYGSSVRENSVSGSHFSRKGINGGK